MSYASVQAIRESSGLLFRKLNETLAGVTDGANKTFTVALRPIVDFNNDDIVNSEDINVYVGDVPVSVASVDPVAGVIVLSAAPAAGLRVTGDYSHSPLSEDYVSGKQEEADSWVDTKLRTSGITPAPNLPLDPVPGVIATIAELYAAGLILTREWGSRIDTEQTSKDGLSKVKQARELIADYIAGAIAEAKLNNPSNGGGVSVTTGGDVFSREYIPDFNTTQDDFFMRRQ